MTKLLAAVLLLLTYCFASEDSVAFHNLLLERRLQLEQDDKFDREPLTSCNSTSCFRYYTDNTAPYLIEQWPDIEFDTGEFYAGSIVIDEDNPNRTLFFVFQPAMEGPVDEITIWLNGGPGAQVGKVSN